MKKLISTFVVLLSVMVISCEENFLSEQPRDFLSSANAYQTYEDFNATVNNLYWLVRREFYNRGENRPFDYIYGTDLVFDGQESTQRHSNMLASYDPEARIANVHWDLLYKIVSESNTLLSRVESSEMTDQQKTLIRAQGRFFRALGYRTLSYLYGGVPLVTEEVTSPKTDFQRAPKSQVLDTVIADLQFAANNLPDITSSADGEINNLAAQHLLSEVYLATERYQDAVDAASVVIDHSATALMQNRFGSRSDETPGDVYWDLFRTGNQNRGAGNTEGIWVIQFDLDTPGGGLSSTTRDGSYEMERHHGPFVRDLVIDGESPFSWPIGNYTAGRGIGWAVSTDYFANEIWQSDFDNDIRNANHNFRREFVATNPNSSFYGDTISTQNPPEGVMVPSRNFYAYQTKVTTPFNHPDGLYSNPETLELKSTAGGTYTDQYMFRLAETYLLRAEGYLGLGQQTEAADDINVVRNRSEASDVAPSEVDIDYILDERMRELGVEEKRRLTLMRLGLLYDRVNAHNPYYSDEVQEHYNLWPIPLSEIESNTGADLEQNSGYN